MAALSVYSQLTLMEANKRLGYDSLAASLGELAQMIDILDVMPWLPATNGTFNRQFQASRLGTGSFSAANQPVPTISSSGDIIEETILVTRVRTIKNVDVTIPNAGGSHGNLRPGNARRDVVLASPASPPR